MHFRLLHLIHTGQERFTKQDNMLHALLQRALAESPLAVPPHLLTQPACRAYVRDMNTGYTSGELLLAIRHERLKLLREAAELRRRLRRLAQVNERLAELGQSEALLSAWEQQR